MIEFMVEYNWEKRHCFMIRCNNLSINRTNFGQYDQYLARNPLEKGPQT